MNKLFYGVSTSQGDADVKEVTIYNPLEEEMAPGDVLAVYFAHGNTVKAPSMVVSNTSDVAEEITDSTDEPIIDDFNDSDNVDIGSDLDNYDSNTESDPTTESDPATTDDSATNTDPAPLTEDEQAALSEDHGIEIKTHDVTADVDYMWQSGEVCLFVLTSQQFNTNIEHGYDSTTEDAGNNALYYMLIRGCRADSEWYGLTKLFTDEFSKDKQYETFEDWIKADDENDKVVAATPYLIKLLARKILGITPTPDPPGPEPTPTPTPSLEITYESTLPTGTDEYRIGKLSVGSTIYNVVIPTPAGNKEYTSDFINDADIVIEEGTNRHKRKTNNPGSYFITNVVDSDLYLYKGANDSSRGIYLAQPPTEGQGDIQPSPPVEGNSNKYPFLIRSGNSTLINSGFSNNTLTIYGQPIKLNTLTVNKTGSNSSSLDLSAPYFIEYGKKLFTKYSGKLKVIKIRLGWGSTESKTTGSYSYYKDGSYVVGRKTHNKLEAATVAENAFSGHRKILLNTGLQGLFPWGIVSYDVSYSSSKNSFSPDGDATGAYYLNLFELYLTERAVGSVLVNYGVKNSRGKTANFIIGIDLLCEQINSR